MTEVHKFSVVVGSNQSILAMSEEMCARIKEVVYSYGEKVPLSVAIGVLHIAAKEILDGQA